MNKRLALNLALAGVIIALALLVIFEPGKQKAPEAPKLTALTPEQVTHVVIERVGRDSIVFDQQGDRWRITQPLNLPANDFRVNAVARIAQAVSYARFKPEGSDLKQYELDQPKLRLTLGDQVIEFGGMNPLDRRRYVRVGDIVHLIGDDNYFRLTGDAAGFANTALIAEHSEDLAEIKLPALTVTHDTSVGKWTVNPAVANLSADDINTFVDEWRHAQALLVAAYSGTPTGDTVTITFSGATPPLVFDVLSKDGDLILGRKDAGVQYQFTGETRQRLFTLKSAAEQSTPTPDTK